MGAQAGHGHHLDVAQVRPHPLEQRGRDHVTPDRRVHLDPGVVLAGQLEVPALVDPTRAPPQRDPRGLQPEVGGVVVGGDEVVLDRLDRSRQVGDDGVRAHVVLALDLALIDHGPLAQNS